MVGLRLTGMAIHSSSGHVWQGRYYSCPLDESHLWEALRYTELNPVRAAIVARPECLALFECTRSLRQGGADSWLAMELWRSRWSPDSWREYLHAGESEAKLAAIRHNTHTGRPLGSAEFTRGLEKQTKRRLVPQKPGPKRGPSWVKAREHFPSARSQPSACLARYGF